MTETGHTYCIDVTNLTKIFGKDRSPAVDHVSLKMPKGQIYGFLGPNGSGKTTTLRMLCGLLSATEGEGTCLGYDIRAQSRDIRRRTGYMTQRFSFWEDLTIRENLKFTADMYGLDHVRERIDRSLENLNLTARQHQLAGALSGGWKQRLALAACILHEPELLLLDEPTAGVDPKARREFWDEIHILADRGISVLVSTHYMDEAERCHSVIYMLNGRIMAEGTVRDLIAGSGLHTWIVRGPRLIELMHILQKNPAITTIAPFGDSLHISGLDEAAMKIALQPYFVRPELDWNQSTPSFEDVFIRYMVEKGHAA